MKSSKPSLLLVALVLLTSCSRLPDALRQDIAHEHHRLESAQRELKQSQATLESDLSRQPDLFKDASATTEWKSRLLADQAKLDSAQLIQTKLDELARVGRADSQSQADQLLRQERRLLETVGTDSRDVLAAADRWLNFDRNLPAHLDEMSRDYDAIRHFDLAPVTKEVEQAGRDWPAKKVALADRLDTLRKIPQQAETQWNATLPLRQAAASNGKLNGTQLATLIETDDDLQTEAATMPAQASEVESLSAQLYDSWDKILTDLDRSRYGNDEEFRERIKTVRTHLTDVASKKGETTSDERWVNVSGVQFQAVQNDLGMAIAHKDAGLFDSEADTTPEPAGFAYIAPESQGSNQYGYWNHAGGTSVWTWLPEYLILRELLWNHDYRPVLADEYRGYRTAQTAGRTYYGQTSPTAPPKYGTHGTFTQTHYADSRYAQHGGFSSSGYATHPTAARAPEAHDEFGRNNGAAGRRFGTAAHPPSGHQFGRSPAFRPGRRFGRR